MTTPSKAKLKQSHSYLMSYYYLTDSGSTGMDRIDVSCTGPASVSDVLAWEEQVKEKFGYIKVTTLCLTPLAIKP